MSNQRGETVFKTFGPEDAGQKVGWVTLEPNPDSSSFYLTGAYATVHDEGATVSIAETVDGKRVWHTGLTRGLSRACAYSILIDPENDTRIANTDYGRFDLLHADQVAGKVWHEKRDIDDEQVHWATGEAGLAETIKETLAEQGQEDFYPYAYLTINGRMGRQLHLPNGIMPKLPRLSDIASVQLYDPNMEKTVRDEMHKISAMNSVLNRWAIDGEVMTSSFEHNEIEPELFEQFRRKISGFHRRIEDLRQTMIAPIVAYVPEGYTRTWPYISASDFGKEQREVQEGNFGLAAYNVEREAAEVRARQEFALQGAHILFALTADGQELAAPERR